MLKIQCITIDCQDPIAIAHFWANVLGWKIGDGATDNEAFIEKNISDSNPDGYPDLLFIKTADVKINKNRVHLDLRPDDQMAEVQRLELMGATRIEIGQSEDPDTTWVVMADPEGNEFCVLRAL